MEREEFIVALRAVEQAVLATAQLALKVDAGQDADRLSERLLDRILTLDKLINGLAEDHEAP